MHDIFDTLVTVTGVVGALANGLMLYCFVRSRPRNDSSTPMIVNQMILDLFCICLLVATYSIKLSGVNTDVEHVGTVVCRVLGSQAFLFSSFNSSTANLLLLSLERYAKVVHPIFHRKHFRHWMYYLAVIFAWIDVPALCHAVVGVVMSRVKDGQCLALLKFPTPTHRIVFTVWTMFGFFVAPLIILVYSYAMMLHVTRKRTRVAVVNYDNMIKSTAERNALRVQLSVIKTFLVISLCFVVCWCPTRTLFFLHNIGFAKVPDSDSQQLLITVTVFMSVTSVCLNPFIYAAQLDPVRKYLLRMFRFRRWVNRIKAEQRVTVPTVTGGTPGTAAAPAGTESSCLGTQSGEV